MMEDEEKIEVGDWISFYDAGILVMDEVKFVRKDVMGYYYYGTLSHHEIPKDRIREVKSL